MKDLGRLITAMVTPFDGQGRVDYEQAKKLALACLKSGSDGVVLSGTTGESPTLTHEEELRLYAEVKAATGRKGSIIAGTGSNSTAEAIEATLGAEKAGVDACLLVTPYYNKPSQEGLYQHFAAIANASPRPVVLYNVPGRTGVNMTATTTLRLAKEFPTICAIKEASGNFTQIDDIIKNKPKEFMVISGDDGITFPLITLGAVGVISVIGNAFPREFSRMVRLALQGDYDNARQIHHHFNELIQLLFVEGNPAGVKSMLAVMGFIENKLRLPLVPNTITTYEKIRIVLNELNIKC
jgi:4-hydroxy-tetrahydrodipicolinate synthase